MMDKENQHYQRRCHVVSDIKNSIKQKQQHQSKSAKVPEVRQKKQGMGEAAAASVIQRCWRNYAIRRTNLQSAAIRVLLEHRNLLLGSIRHRRHSNQTLQAEIDVLLLDPEGLLQADIAKERHRYQQIIQRGIQHLLHEQSERIDRQQQVQLYKQIIRGQSAQHEQLLTTLQRQEKLQNALDLRLEKQLLSIANLSQQLKQEHLSKSKLAYEREYLLAENTRMKRLQGVEIK